MENIQDLLTLLAELDVVVGLLAIIVHAFYSEYKRFVTEVCPPVKPYSVFEPRQGDDEIEVLIQEIKQRATLAGIR
jgi:hypothetical protein